MRCGMMTYSDDIKTAMGYWTKFEKWGSKQ